jgi:hypothetical protein
MKYASPFKRDLLCLVLFVLGLLWGSYIMAKIIPIIYSKKHSEQQKSIAVQALEEHMKTCPECNKEVDNGPPPICEKGFELLKKAMKEEKDAKT